MSGAPMDPTVLDQVLADHRRWLIGDGGRRADLRSARLDGARLDGASLDGASLDGARLVRASLEPRAGGGVS